MCRGRFWSRVLQASLVVATLLPHTSGQYRNDLDPDLPQIDGPIIFPQKSEITLQQGQNFTLECRGTKTQVQFKQQEVPEDVVGSFTTKESNYVGIDYFGASLDLYDVDSFAVGYYACYDATVNSSEVLTSIQNEMENTEHISYIYVYVNGTNNIFAPMRDEVYSAKSGTDFVIPCRPTTPDVTMNLNVSNKKPKHIIYSSKIGFLMKKKPKPPVRCDGRRGTENATKYLMTNHPPPVPIIKGNSKFFIKGETFSLTCSVQYQTNLAVKLTWNIPNDNWENKDIVTNEKSVTDGMLYSNITVINATAQDGGNYSCVSKNSVSEISSNYSKEYKEYGFISLQKGLRFRKDNKPLVTNQRVISMHFTLIDYPPATITCFKDVTQLNFNGSSKYILRFNYENVLLDIKNLTVTDSANYTIVAENSFTKSSTGYDLRVKGRPSVVFGSENDKTYMKRTSVTLTCDVMGYPLPNVEWSFKPFPEFNTPEEVFKSEKTTVSSLYKLKSYIQIPAILSGNVTCKATNTLGTVSASRRFLVYEHPDGFGIEDSKTWFAENEKVSITCMASIYYYNNVTWFKDNEELVDNVKNSKSLLSRIATLSMERISLDQGGNYSCVGYREDGSNSVDVRTLVVNAREAPTIEESDMDQELYVYEYQPVTLACLAKGIPKPKIVWLKDAAVISSDDNLNITTEDIGQTTVNSSISIRQMEETLIGKYECLATNDNQASKFYNVIIREKYKFKTSYMAIIATIFIILLVLVLYLTWKIRRGAQFKREMAAAGLLNFKRGVTGSLNPDLGIDEQAELLPYDEKFEFPPEKLKLGKQLGAGAFGVVYKADARGIIDAEETTPVAVKMVKKTADNMYIKALASELKIMVHLGKHVNIVNLLGACTKHVGKRELIVIVEYCKYGNIHNYLQKHREVFIDQFNNDCEKSFGRDNRGFSYSSANSGTHSDYFGTNQTQGTDSTCLNSNNTNRSRKDNAIQQGPEVSETGYVQSDAHGYLQPQWRSNYESDYSYDGHSPRPLCSRDLICWSFQIARGMEYLASRKVLHGDLAARNILLAEDNIVKICDFGLARSIYNNDEYHKQENSLLPVKWLALECMTDRIFSTQSDVWSFGIVLWEIFSLAKTPYPNIGPERLLMWLSEGNRLSKPQYADDRLYRLMQRCWEHKPKARPTFGQLQEILGSFLEDNVRNHYIDLNSLNMELNAKRVAVEDYLAMVSAPDYSAIVTPSPHPYVNDRTFFPATPTLQQDDEGYLQMSPASVFSPRAHDGRRAAGGEPAHELTPMLTLDNLPARGSDSDAEPATSPYLNMCPRIDEVDEVFERKPPLDSAVTNPTYLKFDVDCERPRVLYSNLANGLVK